MERLEYSDKNERGGGGLWQHPPRRYFDITIQGSATLEVEMTVLDHDTLVFVILSNFQLK